MLAISKRRLGVLAGALVVLGAAGYFAATHPIDGGHGTSLFSTEGFPARWSCGSWPVSLGWLHVVSDVVIFLSYLAIPAVFLGILRIRGDVPINGTVLLFLGFILFCGFGHALEAGMFWWPAYRLGGLVKLGTAAVSASTVVALLILKPTLLGLGSPKQLELLVEERTLKLREAEQRARATFEQAAVGIAHVATDGSWLRVNRRLCSILERSADELLACSFQEITHPADLEKDLDLLQQVIEGEIETYSMEKRYRLPSDGFVWANLTVSLVRDEEGRPKYFISVVEDISPRKVLEGRLQSAKEDLELRVEERTQSLRRSNQELEQFARLASHDLQGPLRTVTSYVEYLEELVGESIGDDGRDTIQRIVRGTTRMKGMIDDLRAYSSATKDSDLEEHCSANLLLKEVLEDLAAEVEESQASVTHTSLPELRFVPRMLSQVLQNLIGNALKYRGSKPLQVHVSAVERPTEVEFRVQDNGIGIDPQHQSKIFEVFQRLHVASEYEGSGIGLSIVKRIIENRGGRIWVESEAGKGSTFYFTVLRSVESSG